MYSYECVCLTTLELTLDELLHEQLMLSLLIIGISCDLRRLKISFARAKIALVFPGRFQATVPLIV